MEKGVRIEGRPAGKFLAGDPMWWTPPEGPVWSSKRRNETAEDRSLKTKRNLSALSQREAKIPNPCNNWRRQRLRPLGQGYLLPAAISPAVVVLSLLFLFLGEAKGFSAKIPVILAMLSAAILLVGLTYLRSRRVGVVKYWRTIISAACLPVAAFYTFGPAEVPNEEFALTILLDGLTIIFLYSSSKAVSNDGARILLPVSPSANLRIEGAPMAWQEGRIHTQVIPKKGVLELSGERMGGQAFLVLEMLGILDVRWDPLAKSVEAEVRKAAISLMQSNNEKGVKWPKWALSLKPADSSAEE